MSEVSEEGVVRKSGMTAGVTINTVIDTNATLKVSIHDLLDSILRSTNISRVTICWEQADKVSLVDNVGSVFAGDSNVDVVCKAKYVVNELGISIW